MHRLCDLFADVFRCSFRACKAGLLFAKYCQQQQFFTVIAVKTGFSRTFRESGSLKDPLTQQIKVGSSIHAAFDQFEPIDLSLNWPIAVGQA